MTSSNARKMRSLAIAAAIIACFAASHSLLAATATCPSGATCVTYTAQGQFSPTIVSGLDTFKLAGQKFSISINKVNETKKPSSQGVGSADYKNLNMTGMVSSALDPTPVTLTSTSASVELAIEKTKLQDVFVLFVPVQVLGLTFDITANITAPYGTITKLRIYPFSAPVTLTNSPIANNTVNYVYTPAGGTPQSTTLTIESGTLSTTTTTGTAPTTGGPTASLDAADAPGMPDAVILRAAAAVPVRRQDLGANC